MFPVNLMKMNLQLSRWIYFFNFGIIGIATGIQWLSISKVFSVGSQPQPHFYVSLCNKGSFLTLEQKQICRQYYSMMSSVADGASMAVAECQRQFVDEQWNCSTQKPVRQYRRRRRSRHRRRRRQRRSVFGNALISGTKEAAFVYAVSSAAVAHSVTRDCSKGLIEDCGCDRSWPQHADVSSRFEWGGCSDNIAWGKEMSRKFIDVEENLKLKYRQRNTGRKMRKRWHNEVVVNLNNNRFGRESVALSMRKQCKCHGVSSSCDQITCWRSLPSFSEVGRKLKHNYFNAVQVHISRKHDRPFLKPKYKSREKRKKIKDLVYLRKSPISCATGGRICNPAPMEHNSCDKICCGRGYSSRTKHVTTKCRCKFEWCCAVNCQTCNSTVTEYVCR